MRQFRLTAAINFDLSGLPINDPVFTNAPPGIELELGVAVAMFVLPAGRDHFDNQIRRRMQFAVFA